MANSERNDFLDLIESDFTISRGTPLPLGATIQHDGINFAVFSRHAQMANLVLFLPGSREPFFEIPLDARYNKTGDIWHVLIEGMNSDIEYGYRLDRANGYSGPFHRFDPDSVILDPYARAISLGHEWGEGRAGLREHERHSFIIRDHFDWENDQPLNIPLSESIIYELHVRGFTQHASSGVTTPGTFAGLVEKIPYLKKLGITAVELLPINEFDETDNPRRNPVTGEDLHNFWGYDSIGFFAPKSSYAVTRIQGDGEVLSRGRHRNHSGHCI
jgi:isoamylase